MKFFNGTFALIGGFIGVVGLSFAIYNHTLDIPGAFLFGALITLGLIATWTKVTGREGITGVKPKGPLSRRNKKKE
ncbi:MAG: hypothetical protein P9L92_16855 [Candidatus Electryonea clarkiae]|nr:hypothetical protein [Candidatus Electryonea clarkiae]MDP8286665.1 hypothetical protein [Candidatus Electryonea clarkiae]